MGGIGTSLHLRRKKGSTEPIDFDALWYEADEVIQTAIHHMCRHKYRSRWYTSTANVAVRKEYLWTDGVRDWLSDRGRRGSSEEGLYFSFYESDRVYPALCLHWYELAFAYACRKLDTLVRRHGLRVVEERHHMAPLLMRGGRSFVRVGSQYFQVKDRRPGEAPDEAPVVVPMPVPESERHDPSMVQPEDAEDYAHEHLRTGPAQVVALTGVCQCDACEHAWQKTFEISPRTQPSQPVQRAWVLLGEPEGLALAKLARQALPEGLSGPSLPDPVLVLHDWLVEREVHVQKHLLPGLVWTRLG
jgi:hypothetical protein